MNRSRGLGLSFGPAGAVVAAGRARVSLGLGGVSAGGRPVAIGRGAARAPRADRIAYRFAGLSEWFVNGPAGLEQGFTVSRPLGSGRLAFDVTVGGARAAAAGGGGVVFKVGGRPILRYGGLVVSDARGRKLPAEMTPVAGGVRISVDTRGAVYPLRVDPTVTQTAELTASDGTLSAELGSSVAVSGHTIAAIGNGAVYVFSSDPTGGWFDTTQTAKLTIAGGAGIPGEDGVAISGSTIAIGGASSQAAVYVFSEPAGGWKNATQTATLRASGAGPGNNLGFSIAIAGQTIVAGAPGGIPGDGSTAPGSAYVYTEPAGGWVNAKQTAKLTASDGVTDDRFGNSVAIDGSTIVVGAPFATGNFNNTGIQPEPAGAAYVFSQPAGGWTNATQTAELAPPFIAEEDFGQSVAVSGSTVFVGVPGYTVVNGSSNTIGEGAVYVFSRPGGGWHNSTAQTAVLTASDEVRSAGLGASVAASGSTVVASASRGDRARGSVYTFSKPARGWANATENRELVASDLNAGNADDAIGQSVGVSGQTVVAGAPLHTIGHGSFEQGAVYVWGKQGTPPAPGPTGPGPAPAPVPVPVVAPRAAAPIPVSAAGTAAVPASCPTGSGGCAARVSLTVATVHGRVVSAARPANRAKHKRAGHKALTIATAKLKLAAGHKTTIKLKLTRKGRSLLKKAKRHRLKATVVVKAGGHTEKKDVTLKLAAGKQRRARAG